MIKWRARTGDWHIKVRRQFFDPAVYSYRVYDPDGRRIRKGTLNCYWPSDLEWKAKSVLEGVKKAGPVEKKPRKKRWTTYELDQ